MDFRTILLAEPNGQLERAVSISLLAERLEPSMVRQTKTAEGMQFRSQEELLSCVSRYTDNQAQ